MGSAPVLSSVVFESQSGSDTSARSADLNVVPSWICPCNFEEIIRELSQRSPDSMAIFHLKFQRLRQLYDPQRKDVAEGDHEVV